MSQITTHVLDTSIGKPAAGITVLLEKPTGKGLWETLGKGETNSDGRIADLLAAGVKLSAGTYRLVFDTGAYFARHKIRAFYPSVTLTFETTDESHYHVPLLLNPYGYSTYRGS
jgi:5-hydroxyisourate hydrolase